MNNSLLWKIEKDELPQSFLFGTMHIYDSRIFRIPTILYRLIDSVDIYLPETNSQRTPHSKMLSYVTVNTPGYSLRDYFSAESYAKIKDIAQIDADILDRYKPFFVASLILSAEDMPSESIDYELLNYASFTGKTICELESIEEQIDAINNIPYREQAEIVESALLLSDKKNDFDLLLNSYKEQNMQTLQKYFKELNFAKIFIDSIQRSRNITMSDKIDSLLIEGYSLFVAVGTMHIPDTDDVKGIVSLLSDKGYRMDAIDFSFIF
jgi:uncharacterized protein YbaP (TraB family)